MAPKKKFPASMLTLFLTAAAPMYVQSQTPDAVAVITELKLNRGEVQIRAPGKNSLERPAVLQSLVPGTQVVVSKDAVAVVLFTDGSKTVTINEKNSPLEISLPSSKTGGGRNLLAQIADLLLGKKQPPAYVGLATRGIRTPSTLLSPRSTKLMTETPNLQWMGMEQQPGTVRVYGPQGLIWTAENVALTQIKYPKTAPVLKPNLEYSWILEKKGFALEKANFKRVSVEEAKSIQQGLASLRHNAVTSASTLTIVEASLLVSNEFFYDARELVIDRLRSDPDEPTLHFLLGEIYDKTGVESLAREEYSEAESLRKGPAR